MGLPGDGVLQPGWRVYFPGRTWAGGDVAGPIPVDAQALESCLHFCAGLTKATWEAVFQHRSAARPWPRSGEACAAGRGVEVCGFVGDPTQEALHVFTLSQCLEVRVFHCQIVVGDVGVDGAVTDGVDGDGDGAAFTLGEGVVALHADAERAVAEGAGG